MLVLNLPRINIEMPLAQDQNSSLEIPMDKPLLNRDFVLITLSAFLFFFTYHSFILLPLRIEELGGTESVIGFIMGSASMATILTTPSVGILIDKFGKKWFLAIGGLVISATTLPFAYLDSLNYWFPVLRVLHGAALSLCFVSAGTLIADVSSPSRRSQAMGVFGICSVLNFALAPLVGKILIDRIGFQEFFIFDFLFGVAAFIVAVFINEPLRLPGNGGKHSSGYFSTLRGAGMLVAAFTLIVAGTGFVSVVTFVPVFAKRLGVESYELFFVAYTVSIISIRLLGGWIPDKYGRKKACIPALLIFTAGIFVLGFAGDEMGLITAGVLFGLGHGMFYPAIYALVMDLTPEADRGKAVSIASSSFTFGGMVGVFSYGVVAETWGFKIMFEAVSIMCLLGFIIFFIYGKDSHEENL